jgi:hypothetical protein
MKKGTKNAGVAKDEVANRTIEKKDNENFPGYPHYPASEDITSRAKRIDVDINTAVENDQPLKDAVVNTSSSNPLNTNENNSDLTNDDFQALASEEIHSTGDDEILTNRVYPVDFAGEDLDIPGSEQDDDQESIGSEDEENNSYSLGGDNHEDLEEDRS